MTRFNKKNQANDSNSAYVFSLANFCMALELTKREVNKERKIKKKKVTEEKRKLFMSAFDASSLVSMRAWALLKQQSLSLEEAKLIVIDLSFCNPFAPYQLNSLQKDIEEAVGIIGAALGLSKNDVESILKTKKDALKIHKEISLSTILTVGVSVAAVVGLAVYTCGASMAGTFLGSAAGLSGAAATAHGLALLGGGTLAMGGFGMAGGAWILTGVAATAGLVVGGGGTLLFEIGSAAAEVELIKAQISFKEIVLSGQLDRAKAQKIILNLDKDRIELKKQLELEQKLNESNSLRIKEIEAILKAMDKSISWMRKAAA